ncbi:MAG: phytochrome family protein [Planctomycetota bacterium]|jgi:hypothetical protein
MARFDLETWLESSDEVGARFASRDLRGGLGLGLFSADRLTVPRGVVAWVRYPDGSHRLLKGGEEAVGEFDAVVVKSRSVTLEIRLEDLLTQEDLPFAFVAEVEISVDCTDADALKDFAGVVLADRAAAGTANLTAYLRPEIEEGVKNYVASRAGADLARGDHSEAMETLFRENLRRPLFEAGLTLHDVQRVRFESDEYERILEDKIEATVEGERARRREIIRSAWVKDQKEELLSHREVQDLVRALEHEGALKEIERRREKLEAEKELQSLAEKAAHEKLEKEARNASNLMKILEDAGFKNVFENFLTIAKEEVHRDAAGKGTGVDPRLHGVPQGRTKRILCVASKQVLAFRPDQTAPAEVYSAAAMDLGMLRSVRIGRRGDREVILGGAQFGVVLFEEGASPKGFPIPEAGDKRGGVNAAAIHGDRLYATHSDYGMVRWNLSEEGEGEIVRTELTKGKKTCRGVHVGALDRLFFAAGSDAYSLLPESLDGTPTIYTGDVDAITALTTTERSVFGGTAGGDVLRWDLSAPDVAPVREIAKRPGPIFMLKTCAIGGLLGGRGVGLPVWGGPRRTAVAGVGSRKSAGPALRNPDHGPDSRPLRLVGTRIRLTAVKGARFKGCRTRD